MRNEVSPEASAWGWKALIIAIILGALFLGFIFLAVSNEPDYMPSQQKKTAAAQAAAEPESMSHNMTDMNHDMASMQHDAASSSAHAGH